VIELEEHERYCLFLPANRNAIYTLPAIF